MTDEKDCSPRLSPDGTHFIHKAGCAYAIRHHLPMEDEGRAKGDKTEDTDKLIDILKEASTRMHGGENDVFRQHGVLANWSLDPLGLVLVARAPGHLVARRVMYWEVVKHVVGLDAAMRYDETIVLNQILKAMANNAP